MECPRRSVLPSPNFLFLSPLPRISVTHFASLGYAFGHPCYRPSACRGVGWYCNMMSWWCLVVDRCVQRDETSSRSTGSRTVAGLTTGDFYITRHSNLSEVHVVFHLVSDDSVSATGYDLTSRHPIIVACRNVLKICFRYDVRHITLPLLLVHEMTEVGSLSALLLFVCCGIAVLELQCESSRKDWGVSSQIHFLHSFPSIPSVSSLLHTFSVHVKAPNSTCFAGFSDMNAIPS